MGIQVKILWSDNAGDNKALQKALEDEEFNIDFQYTAAGIHNIIRQSLLDIKFGKYEQGTSTPNMGWVGI